MADWPTVAEVREWGGVAEEDVSDEQIENILFAEIELQYAYCTFWPWDIPDDELPEPLYQALLRRCARHMAARGLPLGSLPAPAAGIGGGMEYGLRGQGSSMFLPRLDAEVERLEAPYRMTGIA